MTSIRIEGESFLHRKLWCVVERQIEHATSNYQGSFYDELVAMVFALHTLEAYLNFAGERLAPEVWKNEREYFRKEPYRGFQGKLKKVMEIAELPAQDETARPYSTINKLKKLRDLIAHAKTEKIGPIDFPEEAISMFPATTLDNLVLPGSAMTAKEDIEQFIELLHEHARKKTNDVWFKGKALKGVHQYNVKHTRNPF